MPLPFKSPHQSRSIPPFRNPFKSIIKTLLKTFIRILSKVFPEPVSKYFSKALSKTFSKLFSTPFHTQLSTLTRPKKCPFTPFLTENPSSTVLHKGSQMPPFPSKCKTRRVAIAPSLSSHVRPEGSQISLQKFSGITRRVANQPPIFLRYYIKGRKSDDQKPRYYIKGRNRPKTTSNVRPEGSQITAQNFSCITKRVANQAPKNAWYYKKGRNRPQITPKCFTHGVENSPQAAIGMALLMGLQERQAFASPPCSHPPHSIPFRERSIVLPTLHA